MLRIIFFLYARCYQEKKELQQSLDTDGKSFECALDQVVRVFAANVRMIWNNGFAKSDCNSMSQRVSHLPQVNQ